MLEQTLIAYFTSANLIVQIILAILLVASVLSWTIILQRGFALARAKRAVKRFEKKFWHTEDLDSLYEEVEKRGDRAEGLPIVFRAGYAEYLQLKDTDVPTNQVLASAQRAMNAAATYEEDDLESGLSFLATVGSTSPYIGLFGTVWGIMLAFHALGAAQQVTIAMVAPGISEALIATAMGLFAAIPAVIFYNRYVNRVNRLLNRFDAFQESFLSYLNKLL